LPQTQYHALLPLSLLSLNRIGDGVGVAVGDDVAVPLLVAVDVGVFANVAVTTPIRFNPFIRLNIR
jgi:hypothetical protein